ncbi:MAG: radical SAM-associated putative lipoprotein [Mangrovibacterium sp.]
MNELKTKLLTRWGRLLRILVSILGFGTAVGLGACDNSEGDDPIPGTFEYGTPTAKFIVNGQVKAEEGGQAIRNIRVVMATTVNYPQRDTTFTDDQGNYSADVSGFPTNQNFLLKFEDIDGATNGEFQTMETSVEFVKPKFTNGSGAWYKGETSQSVNVNLKAKE